MLLACFAVTAFNLFFISSGRKASADISGSWKNISLSSLRGNIYDCNGEKLVNNSGKILLVANPSVKTADALKDILSREDYGKLLKCISDGAPFICTVPEKGEDSEIIKYVEVFDRYSQNQTACHIVGYINQSDNTGVSAVEKIYDSLLTKDKSELKLRYSADTYNNMMRGGGMEIVSSNYYSKTGVKLTIDKNIQKIAENALKLYGVDDGACVILDSKTGEIKGCASTPVFSPEDISKSLESPGSPFINKAFTAYSVGSVFKSVVCACAVKNGMEDFSFNCPGFITVGDKTFYCSSHTAHGNENMSEALKNSCNAYFISLATELGKKKLLDTARNLGFGEKTVFCDGYESDAGFLPREYDIISQGELANLAFGQGSLMATPLQIAQCYAAFANDGKLRFASLIKSTLDSEGRETPAEKKNPDIRALEGEYQRIIKELLHLNFSYSNYSAAVPDYDCYCGGKTSTAQSGWYDDEGREISHVWFAGFAEIRDKSYAIVVFREKGISGSESCAPVFREIVNRLNIYLRQ